MRRRAITAFALAAALVFPPISGEMAMTVNAAENTAAVTTSVSDGDAAGGSTVELGYTTDSTGKRKLTAPTGVQWGDAGMATWNVFGSNGGSSGSYDNYDTSVHAVYYGIQLYRDGESVGLISSRSSRTGQVRMQNLGGYFTESGVYRFCVQSRSALATEAETSEWSWSDEYTYARPEKVLDSPECYWSNESPGTICWQPVEGATGYLVYFNKDSEVVGGSWDVSSTVTSYDFADLIEMQGAGRYHCKVVAISGDIETTANGVGVSDYYDTTAAADDISGIISDAMEGATSAEALETIKAEINKASLRTAMQTDDTVLNQIKDLESAYAAEQGITVNAPTVSAEAGAYVKADEISVVGAGLNAAAGQEVRLEVSVPAEKEYVPGQYYAISVQLDIQLKRAGESVHELDIPVTITMPIPRGLDGRRLAILHYSEDGSFETVNSRNNGDGTVTFTVSHFSTFAFAEQKEDSGASGNDQPDSADTDEDDSDGNSVSEYVVANLDWDTVGSSIDTAAKAANGQNVDVMAGTRFTVPSSVTGKLAGKRVTLALQTGSGLAFSITGTNVKAAKELKMTVSYGESIPEAVRQQVTAGASFSRMFAMEEKGNYPFRLNVHLSVGKENAGKLACLYYYDETSGRMRLSGTFTVTESGQAMFEISRGDEYIVVAGQRGNAGGSYIVVTGDTLSAIAARNGIGLQKLLSLNPQIKDKNKIYPNQIINIR